MDALMQVTELRTILNAFAPKVVNEALKLHGRIKRGRRIAEASGWILWEGEGRPPKPYEWREIGDQVHYRLPVDSTDRTTVASTRARKPDLPEAKLCPDCGAEAFAQAVCPACAKGKAGIRRMWICGENSDHVFYTE